MSQTIETHFSRQRSRGVLGKAGVRAAAAGALILLGGVIGGVVVAAQGSKPIPPGVWNQLKFGSNELAVVFAVDTEGNIQPYYDPGVGKPEAYQPIANPLHTPWVQMQMGNPKVCWIASDGGQECQTYQ